MPTDTQHGNRRGGTIVAAAVAAVLAVVGGIVLFLGMSGSLGAPEPPLEPASTASPATTQPTAASGSAPSGTSAASTPGLSPDRSALDLGPFLPGSDPVALDIPSIGVHSNTVVGLGLSKDGSIEVPTDFGQPGWYTLGATPGELGPAVISGHVDSTKGPAIFYRLGALKPGAKVMVRREDASVATFVIDKVARYAKADFPTSLVYGTTRRAELRLVTCGGAFDQATGHYVDNIVAFGHLLA